MWSKVVRLFKKREEGEEPAAVSNEEIIDEIGDIKKILRKQGILIEMLKKEILERIAEKEFSGRNLQLFSDAVDSFFYLDMSLQEISGLSPKQKEAAGIVWQKLELMLFSAGIEVIHKTGVSFDPSLHEAVERISDDNAPPYVEKLIQPGYIYRGQVIKPAKVITG
jgi:molecular chaperone GrpE